MKAKSRREIRAALERTRFGVLSLRRYYPGQVQTVGGDYGRPLSLAYPSSRQSVFLRR